ncbi:PspC domain-containing protein [Nocardioides sp.]|uniref:PspC domain-containing protein n=1 Tax=Nocardioides sp. TaxID=35761 RepID=UPI0037830F8F
MTTTPPEAPSGPPPPDPGHTGPRVTGEEVRDLGRLRRSRTDRKVAGVAGGLARHLDVDPLVLRVAFVVLAFFGGAGLILYGACWLLVPEDGAERAPLHLDDRSRTVALVIVGAVAALALVGDSWGAFWFPWPIALVALVALWLLTRNSTPPTPPAPPAYPPAYGQTPGQTYGQTYAPPYGPTHGPTAGPAYPAGPATGPATGPAPAATGTVPPAATSPVPPPTAYYRPYVPPTTYVRPPNPRKRGPILFWFALALIALGEGVLGIVDLAGADVAPSAYPALAVAICGVLLVVGAFFGRAGGIILVGLVAAGVLAATTAADRWDGDQVRVTPAAASAVQDRYWLDAGEQVLDLSQVTDVTALDGRRIELEGGVGRIEVILPADLGARVFADVDGPGHVTLFGVEHGGIDVNENASTGLPADGNEPHIVLDTHLGVGEIEVSQR